MTKRVIISLLILFSFLLYFSPSFQLEKKESTPNVPIPLVNLQQILTNYSYSSEYNEYFDCSDMSALLEKFLEEKGYHSKVAFNTKEHHAWVVVEVNGTWVKVETTCFPTKRLGCLSSVNDAPPNTFYLERFFTFSGEKIVPISQN